MKIPPPFGKSEDSQANHKVQPSVAELLASAKEIRNIDQLRSTFEAAFTQLKEAPNEDQLQELLYDYASRTCYAQQARDGQEFNGFAACASLMELALARQLYDNGVIDDTPFAWQDADSLIDLIDRLQKNSLFEKTSKAIEDCDADALNGRLDESQNRRLGDTLMRVSFCYQNMQSLQGFEFFRCHRTLNSFTKKILKAGPEWQDRYMEYFYNRHVFINTLGMTDASKHIAATVVLLEETEKKYASIYDAKSGIGLQKQAQVANRQGLTVLHGITNGLGGEYATAITSFKRALALYDKCSGDQTAWATEATAKDTLEMLKHNAMTGLVSALVDEGQIEEAKQFAQQLKQYMAAQRERGFDHDYFSGYEKMIEKAGL